MTDRLLELASLWGVETTAECEECDDKIIYRPRLDIAHDLLAKLPAVKYGASLLWSLESNDWTWSYGEDDGVEKTFESAVIALAERAGVKP